MDLIDRRRAVVGEVAEFVVAPAQRELNEADEVGVLVFVRVLIAAVELLVLVAQVVVLEIFPLELNVKIVVIARVEIRKVRFRNRLNIETETLIRDENVAVRVHSDRRIALIADRNRVDERLTENLGRFVRRARLAFADRDDARRGRGVRLVVVPVGIVVGVRIPVRGGGGEDVGIFRFRFNGGNLVNGYVRVGNGQRGRAADAVGFLLRKGKRVTVVVVEGNARAVGVARDELRVDNEDVVVRFENRLIEVGSVIPGNDGESVGRHSDVGRAVVVRADLAARERNIARGRLRFVIELTAVNTAEIAVVLRDVRPRYDEVAVFVGGNARVGLNPVEGRVDDEFRGDRRDALNFDVRRGVERERIGDERRVERGFRRLIAKLAVRRAVGVEVNGIVRIVSAFARFREIALNGKAARVDVCLIVALERIGIVADPRNDERSVVADRHGRLVLVRAAGSGDERETFAVVNNVAVAVDNEFGDLGRVDAEDLARFLNRNGRGRDVVIVGAGVFVGARAVVVTDEIGVDVRLARLRYGRRRGNDERILIGQAGRARERNHELIVGAGDGLDFDFERLNRGLHRAVGLVRGVRAGRFRGVFVAVRRLVVLVAAGNRGVERRRVRRVVERVLNSLRGNVRIGVDDQAALVAVVVVRGNRLNVVDRGNDAARERVDERIARNLQLANDFALPDGIDDFGNLGRVFRSEKVAENQLLEVRGAIEVGNVEAGRFNRRKQVGNVGVIVVRNAHVGQIVTGPVFAVERNVKVGLAVRVDGNLGIFAAGNRADRRLKIRRVVARKKVRVVLEEGPRQFVFRVQTDVEVRDGVRRVVRVVFAAENAGIVDREALRFVRVEEELERARLNDRTLDDRRFFFAVGVRLGDFVPAGRERDVRVERIDRSVGGDERFRAFLNRPFDVQRLLGAVVAGRRYFVPAALGGYRRVGAGVVRLTVVGKQRARNAFLRNRYDLDLVGQVSRVNVQVFDVGAVFVGLVVRRFRIVRVIIWIQQPIRGRPRDDHVARLVGIDGNVAANILPARIDEQVFRRRDGQTEELAFFELVYEKFLRFLLTTVRGTLLIAKTFQQRFSDAPNFIISR